MNRMKTILDRQPVLPAPMCGISDHAQRTLCRDMGAEMTFTQMVSSEGMIRGSEEKSIEVLDLHGSEPMLAIQVFGSDPVKLAEAGRRLQGRGAEVIDLNMGCPARKVTSSNSGSALLRDLRLAREIFTAMRRAIDTILTVKMRWDFGDEGDGASLEAARMAEAEGFEAIALHARTRQQGYSGEANWDLIARMKEAVAIPVIGNGDIREPADALEMMRHSGCDGVMIGRALIGDPWLLRDCLEACRTGEAPAGRRAPDWPQRRALMLRHAQLMWEDKGERGVIEFRKHASAYLRGLPGAKKLRGELVRMSHIDDVAAVLRENPLEPEETE